MRWSCDEYILIFKETGFASIVYSASKTSQKYSLLRYKALQW